MVLLNVAIAQSRPSQQGRSAPSQRWCIGTTCRQGMDHRAQLSCAVEAVEVNGIPRHVHDLRSRISTEDGHKQAEKKEGETEEWLVGLRHSAEPAQGGDEAS